MYSVFLGRGLNITITSKNNNILREKRLLNSMLLLFLIIMYHIRFVCDYDIPCPLLDKRLILDR